jgi:hypothetical protein
LMRMGEHSSPDPRPNINAASIGTLALRTQ